MITFRDCPLSKYRNLRPDEVKLYILFQQLEEGTKRGKEVSEQVAESFMYRVMEKRIQLSDAKIDNRVVMFISMICKKPGDATLWAGNLVMDAKANGPIKGLHDYAERFPGIPNEEWRKKCWDSQKNPEYPDSNLLDSADFWDNPLKFANSEQSMKSNHN